MSLADLTATELVSRYRERSLSPVEVIEDVLARVDQLEPQLCAHLRSRSGRRPYGGPRVRGALA